MRAWNNQGAKLMDLKNKVAIVLIEPQLSPQRI
jgi:hypothetical protein